MTTATKTIIAAAAWLVSLTAAHAQCTIVNTAFDAGETLKYDLYFNWKFVWVNAGTATMSTDNAVWEDDKVLESKLITQTSKQLDKFFMMRDTLRSVVTTDIVPLYYKKAANEGGKYYKDQVWYSYRNGGVHLEQEYQNRKGEVKHYQRDRSDCVYDMMSMMLRARSFDASSFKVNDKLMFPMADGDNVSDITLIFRGKKNFKMRKTGVTYRCLIFSFVEYEGKKEKEIITFYITDDANHIPVRLDMFLKFGTAKAYLNKATGLKHECTSIIRK